MNYLLLLLNRVYFFLIKVKNQSPFLGASILVSLLIFFNIGNVILLVYSFRENYHKIDIKVGVFILLIIFFLLYYYANKKKKIVVNNVKKNILRDVYIVVKFIMTIIIFVYLANINRQKISKERETNQLNKLKKESLEGKIRKWFNE